MLESISLLIAIIQNVNAPVYVNFTFDPEKRKAYPEAVVWNGRTHVITKIGLHHAFRNGRTLYHVFSVESPSLFFKLVLNTDTLHWTLEQISDGESN